MKWERTFEFSADIDRVWAAFTDPDAPFRVFNPDDAYRSGGAVTIEVNDERTNSALAWTETEGENRWDMAVTFEETETGSRITIVRSGFGSRDDFKLFGESRLLGWEQVLADFEVFLRTGVRLGRFASNRWGSIGIFGLSEGGGIGVRTVIPGRPAAEAGVRLGDIVVRIGELPIYGPSDLWAAERLVRPDTEFQLIRDGALITASAGIPAPA